MSKIVTIPTDGGNPFVVILGGVKYVYKPGETVTVPDGVALEIEERERWRDKYRGAVQPPFAGGGVENLVLLADFITTEDVVKFEVQSNDVETEFREIFIELLTRGLSSNTGGAVSLSINGVLCCVCRSFCTNVENRQSRAYGRINLQGEKLHGLLCAGGNVQGHINTTNAWGVENVYADVAGGKRFESIAVEVQGSRGQMKAGSYVKVWGVK